MPGASEQRVVREANFRAVRGQARSKLELLHKLRHRPNQTGIVFYFWLELFDYHMDSEVAESSSDYMFHRAESCIAGIDSGDFRFWDL